MNNSEKAAIYYFSGTGNSLFIAKGLAQKIPECELIPMAKALQQEHPVIQSDVIGLVFPLHYWGLPDFVVDFVKRCDFQKTPYIFAVLTRGGSPGYTLNHLTQLLHSKSQELHAGFHITMIGNFIVAPYYSMSDETLQKARKKIITNAEAEIERIAGIVKTRQRHVETHSNFFNPVTKFLGNLLSKTYKKSLKEFPFRADQKCQSCWTCQAVCPVSNIQRVDGKPVWQNNCQHCMACIQLCPAQAIQFKDKTQSKMRYHHPGVTVKEMMWNRSE